MAVKLLPWASLKDRLAPTAAFLILALPPGGKGQRTFQCLACERPDPLNSEIAAGWLKSELRPPK